MKNFSKNIALIFSVLVVSAILSYAALAWIEPGSPAPAGNVAAPINTGNATQTKNGALTIAGNMRTNTGFCINSDCITSWANITSPWTKSGNNIYSNNSGNVGIGTAAPWAKLTVSGGKTAFTRDGVSECCGNDATIALGENTSGTGRKSSISFHNGGIAEGTLELAGGGNRRFVMRDNQGSRMGLEMTGNLTANGELQSTLNSGYGQLRMIAGNYGAFLRNDGSNTYFLLTASGDQYGSWNTLRPLYVNNSSGNVSIDTKLCLNGTCRSTWPGMNAQSCPSSQGVVGIDSSGNIVCSGSGFSPFKYPCNQTLPTGAKKIFVTSAVYTASDITNDSTADSKCQLVAQSVGYSGTYKALEYSGGRNINTIIPSGQSLWNGQASGATCTWNLVAYNAADLFTDDGGGNYLQNAITYNEQGLSMAGVGVWTSFRPTGGGNYDLLSHTNQTCHGFDAPQQDTNAWKGSCYYRGTHSSPGTSKDYYKESTHWYGIAGNKNNQWAYNSWCQSSAGYDLTVWNNCYNNQRSLYCVEQ
jgi:hypothetical protein